MNHIVVRHACVLAFFSSITAVGASEGQWQEVSHDGGVVVYRREVKDSPVMAYRAEAMIDAPIARVMAIVKDTPSRSKWADRVQHAELVRELSPCERIEYMQADAPWPVKDRDVVYRVRYQYDLARSLVAMRVESVEDSFRPVDDDHVRAVIHNGDVELVAVDGGKRVRATVELHADPRGSIPKWIVDIVQKRAPKKSLFNLMRELKRTALPDDAMTLRFLEKLNSGVRDATDQAPLPCSR